MARTGNPYAQGVACERDYLVGPPCGAAATLVLEGRAYCAECLADLLLSLDERGQERVERNLVRLDG